MSSEAPPRELDRPGIVEALTELPGRRDIPMAVRLRRLSRVALGFDDVPGLAPLYE